MAKGYDTTVTRARRLTEKTKKKTDKPDGKPVLCQRTFSSVFRAVFFYTAKLHSLTVSVWAPHLFLSKFLFFLSVIIINNIYLTAIGL